jgi:hypothetical protein
MIGVRFPARAGNFSLRHRFQTGSEAHPASCPMSTRGSLPGNKSAGAYWYETWPLTLREEHRLRLSEKSVEEDIWT